MPSLSKALRNLKQKLTPSPPKLSAIPRLFQKKDKSAQDPAPVRRLTMVDLNDSLAPPPTPEFSSSSASGNTSYYSLAAAASFSPPDLDAPLPPLERAPIPRAFKPVNWSPEQYARPQQKETKAAEPLPRELAARKVGKVRVPGNRRTLRVSQLGKARKALGEKNVEVVRMGGKIEKLVESLEEKQREVDEARRALGVRNSEFTLMKLGMGGRVRELETTLAGKVRELEGEIEDKQQEMERRLEEKQKEVDEANAQMSWLNIRVRVAEKMVVQKDTEIDELKATIAEMKQIEEEPEVSMVRAPSSVARLCIC
ncbi:hypothetical protein OE88DRAFT_481142 [Heliocybe sulcata]|uniref:Uncharacterized protein n=1 Tax=Heliocybe sulcata TaxID=5364 RepID=A0A5C3MXW9_9AGAM|nr:hypothetical protein OE88DRAFT_481142 [Heliocybe sulcata]